MSFEDAWTSLHQCVSLKVAMVDAQGILELNIDIGCKQSKLKAVVEVYELEQKQFEAAYMEIGSDDEDEEEASLLELMQMECRQAAEDTATEEERIVKANVFEEADVKAVVELVKAIAAAGYKRHALKGMSSETESEAKAKIEAELPSLDEAVSKQTRAVEKARRGRRLRVRKSEIQSPKRAGSASSEAPANKKERVSATDLGSLPGDAMHFPDIDEPTSSENIVSVLMVIDGMLEDVAVCVKLFYTPHDVSHPTSTFSSGGTFDLYETRVAADGLEYALIAFGGAATRAAELLAGFAGKVVTLRHVKFAIFQNVAQIELMENFEVFESCEWEGSAKLQRQPMKRYTVKQIIEQADKARVSLEPCAVGVSSEVKFDKNGKPYRATRVMDRSGAVTNVTIWGELSAKADVWEDRAVIDIRAAEVSYKDKRLNLRNFSQVEVSAEAASFQIPNRLAFVKWP